ncbi:MAG TPA: ABC transporter permease subunit [Candidatus Dormibacteraeota bacterium]|nr:ABC transporter permease subunit [Candidatus Dormibacteraeota bacterium]
MSAADAGGALRVAAGRVRTWSGRPPARALAFLAGMLPVAVAAVFVGLPILLSALYTLGDTGGPNATVAEVAQHQVVAAAGLTLTGYQRLFATPGFGHDLWVTAWITVLSTVILLALAWVLSLYLRFSRGRVRAVVSTLYTVPMFVPVVIASYALVSFWETNGKLAALLHAIGIGDAWLPGFTSGGVVLGLVWTNLPFAVIMIGSGLQAVPDALIEAARDVGARPWRVLLSVLVPLNRLPSIIVLTFTATGSLGSYTVPYLMGPNAPQMLGVAMTSAFQDYQEPQQAESMAMLVFLAAAGLSFLYVRANRRELRRMAGKR